MNDITIEQLFEFFRKSTIEKFGGGYQFGRKGRSFYAFKPEGKNAMRATASYCMICYTASQFREDLVLNEDKALLVIQKELGDECYNMFYMNRYESRVDRMLEECNQAIDDALDKPNKEV